MHNYNRRIKGHTKALWDRMRRYQGLGLISLEDLVKKPKFVFEFITKNTVCETRDNSELMIGKDILQ